MIYKIELFFIITINIIYLYWAHHGGCARNGAGLVDVPADGRVVGVEVLDGSGDGGGGSDKSSGNGSGDSEKSSGNGSGDSEKSSCNISGDESSGNSSEDGGGRSETSYVYPDGFGASGGFGPLALPVALPVVPRSDNRSDGKDVREEESEDAAARDRDLADDDVRVRDLGDDVALAVPSSNC